MDIRTILGRLDVDSGLSPHLWESKEWLTHAIQIFAGLGGASVMAASFMPEKRRTGLDIAFDAIRAEVEEGASVIDLMASRGADLS